LFQFFFSHQSEKKTLILIQQAIKISYFEIQYPKEILAAIWCEEHQPWTLSQREKEQLVLVVLIQKSPD